MGSTLSRVVLGAVIAAAAMIGRPASVLAQPAPAGAPAPVDPQTRATAKKLAEDAQVEVDAKNYDKAIELYQKAYDLTGHPLMLFNMAQAHRLAGRLDKAAELYDRYLKRDPSGTEAPAASAALADLKAAGVTPPPAAPEPVVTKPEAPPDEAVSAFRTPEPEEPVRVDTAASPGRGWRLTGMVLGGAGLVSLAAGVYFTTRVLHWEEEAAKALMEGRPLTNAKGKGEAAELRGDIAYGLAGALVIGGAVTYWLGHKKGREAQTTAWTPVVGPGFAGITLSGSLR